MQKPPPTAGLCHVALSVKKLEECLFFYTELLGFKVEWQPDPDNYYLTSGVDNLALHRLKTTEPFGTVQRLDHIGFLLRAPADVDAWHEYLAAHQVIIKAKPRTHRDGARSFYCEDPDGIFVQMIYHPPLVQGIQKGEDADVK